MLRLRIFCLWIVTTLPFSYLWAQDTLYRSEEVRIEVEDFVLAGTLTYPPEGKPPVLVLISGSGPQDRDSNLFGFKLFGDLAHYLSNRGIAVLRLDDRGVGSSTGSMATATSADFAQDIGAAVRWLSQHPHIDPHRIGLYGHSEGGVIAPMVATQYPELQIACLVLAAPVGVRGDSLLMEQSRLILGVSGQNPEQITKTLAFNRLAYQAAIDDQGWDELEGLFGELVPNATEQAIKNLFEQQKATLQSPWMRFFLRYDPVPALQKVRCPTLLLFGDKDLQVPPDQNEAPMLAALRQGYNPTHESKRFPEGNHLFQAANTGNPAEYMFLEKSYLPGYLEYLHQWLEQTGFAQNKGKKRKK